MQSITQSEASKVFRAEQMLISSCMKAAGFVYTPAEEDPLPQAVVYPYGIDDVDWASAYGIGNTIPYAVNQLLLNDPTSKYVKTLSPRYQAVYTAALHGTDALPKLTVVTPGGNEVERSADGCLAQSEGKLFGDAQKYFAGSTIFNQLKLGSEERILELPEFLAGVDQWSACMKKKDFDFDSPSSMHQRNYPSQDQQLVTELEIRLGEAEAVCVLQVGLGEIGRRLSYEWLQNSAQNYTIELIGYLNCLREGVRAADPIIAQLSA